MRSFLFVPADGGKKLDKATASGADAVIVDLEDSIAPEGKARARDGWRNQDQGGGENPEGIGARGMGGEVPHCDAGNQTGIQHRWITPDGEPSPAEKYSSHRKTSAREEKPTQGPPRWLRRRG